MAGRGELRDKIERFAVLVRNRLNLSSPLNMLEVVEKLGIDVCPVENVGYDARISERDSKFFIDYDKNQIFERQQFSIAHELGHLLLHEFNEGTHYRKKGISSHLEWEANEFAAALLMPRREFIDFCLNNADTTGRIALESIAKNFQVSRQAVKVRGSVLGLWRI